MNQRIVALSIIIIVILVLIWGGIWYWRNQSKEKPPVTIETSEKPPVTIDTSTWLPYVVGHIQFRYPADWKIEEREITLGSIKQKNLFGFITQTALAQTQETTIEITLTPPTKQLETDVIKIGGEVRDCEELKTGFQCEEKIDIPIYTASKSDVILQTFNKLVKTFDIYFEVADIDTRMAIDDVKIRAVVFPNMTGEEFTEKYIRNCPPTRRTNCVPGICYSCIDVPEGEGRLFTKQEFKEFINEGPLGVYNYTVEAKGYRKMSSYSIKSEELRKFGDIMMMSPLSSAQGKPREDVPELREEYIRSLLKPGAVLVIGFVVDEFFLKPLAGVKVSIPKLNLTTETNARGFYFFNVPEYSGKIDSCEKMIETALGYTYSKDGFKIFEQYKDYPIKKEGDLIAPHYAMFEMINATMFYGTGKIIHEYMPHRACQ